MRAGFINPMLAKCKEFNIPIRLNTKVVDLITNEKGCVLGVRVETHYRNEKARGPVLKIFVPSTVY